jgi:DNA polymerase
VVLASATDLDGFRRACRSLFAEGVAPEDVDWQTPSDTGSELFAAAPLVEIPPDDDLGGRSVPKEATAAERASSTSSLSSTSTSSAPSFLSSPAATSNPAAGAPTPAPSVPAAFVELCESVILHRDPGRFALLYRLLWRFQREPGLRHDPLDPDRLKAEDMARAVRRDMHKMKAFVRFRPLPTSPAPDAADGTTTDHVAWFEPEHHIVEAIAPFFVRRFTQMHWAILTPQASVRWDGRALELGPGARREEAPAADAGERLWLTYYQSIFNPARLKRATMEREMPRRYWANLPEAKLIEPLTSEAARRSHDMIAKGPTDPQRRLPKAPTRPTEPNQAVPVFERPSSLADLAQALDRCRECPIGAEATQAVPGEGPREGARLMFVGEQPGDQEDLRGRPFVGPAGQLLDRAFDELGWPRDKVYVTNAVKHFKFELRGKRRIHKTPAQQEAAACLHWLESEIELLQPEALVALGATAARQLLGRVVPVMRERGHWLVRGDGRRVLITLHPSALLRLDPSEKAAAYADWLQDLRQADGYLSADDGSGDGSRDDSAPSAAQTGRG